MYQKSEVSIDQSTKLPRGHVHHSSVGNMNTKTQIEHELESLREKAVARNLRYKYSGSGSFLSPEEAEAYLAKQRRLQDPTLTAPANLTTSSEISNWYMIQRQRELDERKKREEAEAYMRAYRPHLNITSKNSFTDSIASCPSHESQTINCRTNDDDESSETSSPIVDSIENIGGNTGNTPVVIFSSSSQKAETLKVAETYKKTNSYDNVEVALPGTDLPTDVTQFSPKHRDEEIKPMTKAPVQNYHTVSPRLPFSLTDLSDWYMIQKQRQLEERKNREEAEKYLRSYRPQWFKSDDRKQSKHGKFVTDNKENQVPIVTDDTGKEEMEGARLSPVLRLISHFLQDQFNDENHSNRLFFPTLKDSMCQSPTSTVPETESLVDMHHRFELHLNHGCPFSHQIAVCICLKGLINHFSVKYHSSPTTEEEIYHHHNGSSNQLERMSIPIPCLVDKKEKLILSTDPSIILQKINSDFNSYARFPNLDLYPIDHRIDIDDITHNLIYKGLYEGAVACGLAKSQQEYELALDSWLHSFDQVHALLQLRRYIAGSEHITLADITLFTVLILFDDIFAYLFHVNHKLISAHPTIMNYLREIYQMPNVEETVDMEAMKAFYYEKYSNLIGHTIIPRGNDYFLSRLKQPHNRISSIEYFMQAFEAKTG